MFFVLAVIAFWSFYAAMFLMNHWTICDFQSSGGISLLNYSTFLCPDLPFGMWSSDFSSRNEMDPSCWQMSWELFSRLSTCLQQHDEFLIDLIGCCRHSPMVPIFIVKPEMPCQRLLGFKYWLIGVELNFLIFNVTPQAFDDMLSLHASLASMLIPMLLCFRRLMKASLIQCESDISKVRL
mgnify:CR=1 FL=1